MRTRLELLVLANQQTKEGKISGVHCQPRWKSSGGGGSNDTMGNGGSGKKVERAKLTRIELLYQELGEVGRRIC